MTHRLTLALVLTAVWVAVTGWFNLPNVALGLLVGLATAALVGRAGPRGPRPSLPGLAALAGLFLVELAKSASRVARMALGPRLELRPGFIAYPLALERDAEITLLANLITLTPGTLSVDVSEDRRFLFIHCVDLADAETEIEGIRQGFERRIRETFR